MAEKGLDKPPILTWNTWSKDPIKKAVIVAIISRLAHTQPVDSDILGALAQKAQELVCFIHFYSLGVEEEASCLNNFRSLPVLSVSSISYPHALVS